VALLPDQLARRFARLGVFAGGFTTEAADVVAGATPADVTALVRASLVVNAGDGRYRQLETVREYAGELIGDDHDRVADAHAEWYRRLALDSDGTLPVLPWIQLLDQDRANLRAALERLAATAELDHPVGERLLELAAVLGRYWYNAGPASADTEWLPRALALAPDADPAIRGKAAYALGICRAEQGLATEAIEHCRTAYELLRAGPDRLWAARALNSLASLSHDIGRSEEAASLLDESIAVRRALNGALPLAIPLSNRATVAVHLGDPVTARACLEEILRTEGDNELETAFALMGLADVELLVGDADAAGECLRIAVETVLGENYQDYRLMECLETFAALAVVRGRADLAVTLLAAVDKAYAEEGSLMVPADIELRERRTGAAIAALSPERRATAEARGATLDLPAAVRLAASVLLS
jgi:tetratricopeptide (TPR) repeat protein